jgi:uncharacterized phage protein (TIGR02220 family)
VSKYRPIDVRVWNDRKFLALSSDARLLWLFLLTTPSTLSIPGVVIGGEAALAEQLGTVPSLLRERFRELVKVGLSVRNEGRLTWLPNALKYQPPHNPNQVKAWAKAWDDVPEGPLKREIWEALKVACKSWSQLFARLFAEPFQVCSANGSANGSGNRYTQDQEQDQDQEQKQDQDLEDSDRLAPVVPPLEILKSKVDAVVGEVGARRARKSKPSEPTAAERESVRVVLEKLSTRNGVRYSGTAEHTRLIVNHLRAGVTEMDLRAVIGYCALELDWATNADMAKYLRPETLFGPKTIDRYLDPARTWFAKLPEDTASKPPERDPYDEPDWMQGGAA